MSRKGHERKYYSNHTSGDVVSTMLSYLIMKEKISLCSVIDEVHSLDKKSEVPFYDSIIFLSRHGIGS